MPLEPVTKEEWYSWREHPVTAHFFQLISEKRESILDVLSYGSIESEKQQDRLVGRVAALTDVMSTTFED